jgi:hypothetical protein
MTRRATATETCQPKVNRAKHYEPEAAKGDHDARVASQPIAETVTDPKDVTDDHVELMQAYIAGLLDRVHGAGRSEGPVAESQVETTGLEVSPDRECVPPGAPAGLTPGPQPPERAKLSAMRDLANTEARAAIAANRHAQQLQQARRSSMLGLACLPGMLFFFWAPPIGPILGIAALAGLIAGIYYCIRAALTAAQASLELNAANTSPARSTGRARVRLTNGACA